MSYRKNVAAIILSSSYPKECKFFVAKRIDYGIWQFVQGGIDGEETPKEALLREMKEEISTNDIEIICECDEWLRYDFPDFALEKMKPFKGQIQKYFLVRLKSESGININTKEPEFSEFKFVDIDYLYNMEHHFKKDVYIKALNYFKEKGYI